MDLLVWSVHCRTPAAAGGHNGPMASIRVAVVLGAGGAVGHAFHAGVLASLDEQFGWDAGRADLLVGTSAGSIVAALLRAGLPAADLFRRATGQPPSARGIAVITRARLGPPRRPAPGSRSRGRGIASPAFLARALRAPWEVRPGALAAAVLPAGRRQDFHMAAPIDALHGDRWPAAPTWIVAVELDTGRRVVFGRAGAPPARVAEAVTASCAIPAYYEPAEINGSRYVDGGVHSTTNAAVVAAEQPELVLVSAPMSAARGVRAGGPGMALRQIARLSLAREVARLRRQGTTVVAFQPTAADIEVMGTDALDPDKIPPVATRVFETTSHRLARADVRDRLSALA
jgi:NTE family protein